MARVEATLSQIQSEQLESMAAELEMPKAQIVSEALALLMKALAETKCGRRVAILDPVTQEMVYAYSSPALSQMEWVSHRVSVTPDQLTAIANMVNEPAAPNESLRRAMSHRKLR
jgi:hypothetical protein